eukprot:gene8270-11195_t
MLFYISIFNLCIISSGLNPSKSGGFYAHRVPHIIAIDGRYFDDPPGGVEAMIQLSLSMKAAAMNPSDVFIIPSTGESQVNYHEKWLKLYGKDNLIHQYKSRNQLKPGDIYIINEGIGCPTVPEGVIKFVYLLANYMGCQEPGWRYISHNHYLSNFTYENKTMFLPLERIIHPYISDSIVHEAVEFAGLDSSDGSISYHSSIISTMKKNLVLIDDDAGIECNEGVKQAAEAAGGEGKIAVQLSPQQMIEHFKQAKVIVDWCMRGSERSPMEASLFGAIFITNDCDNGIDFSDSPIPKKYNFPKNIEKNRDEFVKQLTPIFKDIFENYWSLIPQYEPFRRMVLSNNHNHMVIECIRFLSTIHIDQTKQKLRHIPIIGTNRTHANLLSDKPCLNC